MTFGVTLDIFSWNELYIQKKTREAYVSAYVSSNTSLTADLAPGTMRLINGNKQEPFVYSERTCPGQ